MELLDELGEDITNARLRLRNDSASGAAMCSESDPAIITLVKGVSVANVNETLIAFFLAAACSHSQSSLTSSIHPRDCRADFLSLSLLTTIDISPHTELLAELLIASYL